MSKPTGRWAWSGGDNWECEPVARKTQSKGHLTAKGSALVTEKRVKTTTTTNAEGERGSFFFKRKKEGKSKASDGASGGRRKRRSRERGGNSPHAITLFLITV